MDQLLDRRFLQQALERVNEILRDRRQSADLFIVRGAVMCLVHDARPATKDVDAWFSNPAEVRQAAHRAAEELDLADGWLNDAAKGFVPAGAGYDRWQELSNLTISTADDRTLLAMKCCASRTDEDMADIRFLTDKPPTYQSSLGALASWREKVERHRPSRLRGPVRVPGFISRQAAKTPRGSSVDCEVSFQ